jgi:hypothetical protein
MWRVFLLEPKPICTGNVLVSSAPHVEFIQLISLNKGDGIMSEFADIPMA